MRTLRTNRAAKERPLRTHPLCSHQIRQPTLDLRPAPRSPALRFLSLLHEPPGAVVADDEKSSAERERENKDFVTTRPRVNRDRGISKQSQSRTTQISKSTPRQGTTVSDCFSASSSSIRAPAAAALLAKVSPCYRAVKYSPSGHPLLACQ